MEGSRIPLQEEGKNNSSVFSSSGQIGSDIDTHKQDNDVNSYSQRDVMFNKPPLMELTLLQSHTDRQRLHVSPRRRCLSQQFPGLIKSKQ